MITMTRNWKAERVMVHWHLHGPGHCSYNKMSGQGIIESTRRKGKCLSVICSDSHISGRKRIVLHHQKMKHRSWKSQELSLWAAVYGLRDYVIVIITAHCSQGVIRLKNMKQFGNFVGWFENIMSMYERHSGKPGGLVRLARYPLRACLFFQCFGKFLYYIQFT